MKSITDSMQLYRILSLQAKMPIHSQLLQSALWAQGACLFRVLSLGRAADVSRTRSLPALYDRNAAGHVGMALSKNPARIPPRDEC